MLPIKIKSTGIYAPGEAISNAELIKLIDTDLDTEKLKNKLGIEQRHMAHLRGLQETTADFATAAGNMAIKKAGINPDEIGLFIVASDTPEYISPSTTIVVQGRIQGKEKWTSSFDVNASCASFAIAFDNAARIMATDETIKYALVIGVYNMPAYLRKDDPFGYAIFADGAGAFLLERNADGKQTYINGQNLTDGTQYDYIGVYAGGTKMPITKVLLEEGKQGLLSLKPLPGDRNVRLWPMVVEQLLKKSSTRLEEIDHFIFTQINKSVIIKVMETLNLPLEKTSFSMDKYGYTGSACLPITFYEAEKAGKIKRGNKIMMVASGAGLAVGSNLFTY